MRNLFELNINLGGRPIDRSKPTDEIVREFESRYGLRLPDDFLALLRHSNGGHPELDSIQPAGNSEGSRWAVNWFYHLDSDRTSANSLWRAMEQWSPILHKQMVPFASDSGGNQFILDLQTVPPVVRVCVHDEHFKLVYIAPSFASFIDLLAVDPDMI